MYHDHVIVHVDNCDHDVIDDVIMSKYRSKFWTTVTWARASKMQEILTAI